LTSKQKSLKNNELCSVYIYHRVNWSDVLAILGKCRNATNNDLGNNNGYIDFVRSQVSSQRDGFISVCNLNKLIEIQKATGYDFNISKNIKKLL